MLTPPTIEEFFDYEFREKDEPIFMYAWSDGGTEKRLYLINQHRRKVVQLIVKDEPAKNDQIDCAQIKVVPYQIHEALVYRDEPDDPQSERLYDPIEITYHGGPKGDMNPKIHLKGAFGSGSRYRTLVDNSLRLNRDQEILVPLFSVFPGDLYRLPAEDTITKKSHIFQVRSTHPIRCDLYLCGKQFNMHNYFNSMYSHSMFSSLDYLISKERNPLQSLPIVQPITGFDLQGYYIWVRCSRSHHVGKPFLQFYHNADYYGKVMNRRIAYPNPDGSLTWRTKMEKEREISEWLRVNNTNE